MTEIIISVCIALGVSAPPAYVTTTTHPVIDTPCYEDEIAWVMDYRFEPAAHQRGYWDGDDYFRMCIPVDDIIVEDGELIPVYDD